MLLITPSLEELAAGLEAWGWIGLEDKSPISVNAFGDVFFEAEDGIWFLDTIEGTLTRIANSVDHLEKILNTEIGQGHYLMADLVIEAGENGLHLDEDQCYEFTMSPALGGEMDFSNMGVQDIAAALIVSGQIHEQVKDLPDGAKINEITIK